MRPPLRWTRVAISISAGRRWQPRFPTRSILALRRLRARPLRMRSRSGSRRRLAGLYTGLAWWADFTCVGGGYCAGVEGPAPPPKSALSGVAAIADDANGALTLAGSTFSDGFPVTAGVIDGVSVGFCEYDECSLSGFVAKLDPTGSVLIYSTCFSINFISGSRLQFRRFA